MKNRLAETGPNEKRVFHVKQGVDKPVDYWWMKWG